MRSGKNKTAGNRDRRLGKGRSKEGGGDRRKARELREGGGEKKEREGET